MNALTSTADYPVETAPDFTDAPRTPIAASRNLASLRAGQSATVVGLRMPEADHGHGRHLVMRLLEIGFVEGEPVRVMALGPGGREPLAVRVGGTMFALRRHEAEHVLVELAAEGGR